MPVVEVVDLTAFEQGHHMPTNLIGGSVFEVQLPGVPTDVVRRARGLSSTLSEGARVLLAPVGDGRQCRRLLERDIPQRREQFPQCGIPAKPLLFEPHSLAPGVASQSAIHSTLVGHKVSQFDIGALNPLLAP
jgi:hypothetical protein